MLPISGQMVSFMNATIKDDIKLSIVLWRTDLCVLTVHNYIYRYKCASLIMSSVCGEIHQCSLDPKCATYIWRINQSYSRSHEVQIIFTPLQCKIFILQSDASEGDTELENLEEAFDLMKRAAGVDTVEEVVERFKTQDFTGKVL